MNIDQTYKKRVRIQGKPGDTKGYQIHVYDLESGEELANVYRVHIMLDVDKESVAYVAFREPHPNNPNEMAYGVATTPNPQIDDVTAIEMGGYA